MSLPTPDPIGGGGSGPPLSNATPSALGTASAGVSTDASRADHRHAMPSAADVGAAATSHTHAASAITSGTLDSARLPSATTLVSGAVVLASSGEASSSKAVTGTDSRLSDSRAPLAHASSHQNGGSDEIATATPGANAIPKAGADGKLAAGWLPAATTSAAGAVQLAADGGTTAGQAVQASDSRLSYGSQSVSTATVLSGAYDLNVRITASFNGAITLPASATVGRVITIIDEAGVGSGDANGSSTNLIHVLCAGSDTITAPGVYGSLTRMLLWKRYGVLQLRDDGAGGWHAVRRHGWHIDPRSIASLKWWIDSRRGITLNGTTVSAWADLSGGGANLSQGTAANRPAYIYSGNAQIAGPGDENSVIGVDSTDTMATSASVAFTTGAMAMVLAYNYRWQNSSTANAIVKSSETSTTGFAYFPNTTAVASCASAGNAYARGHGTSDDASGPFCSSVRNYQTSLDETIIDAIELSSTRQDRRLNRTNLARTFGASATLDSFTQTLSVFNGLGVCRLFNCMLFNASLSASDTFNLEAALTETFK